MASIAPASASPAPRWHIRSLPAVAILGPALLSLAAWLAPIAPAGLTGYFDRADVTLWGIGLVVAWYGTVVSVAQVGYTRGRQRGGMASLERVSTSSVHWATCILGLIGTAWAYWVASGGSLSRIVTLWRTQQFNTLRAGFEYGVGLPTLRYAAIIAGALSIAHLVQRGRVRRVDILSLLALIAASFLASRLTITAAVFAALIVLVNAEAIHRPRLGTLIAGVLALVTLFVALNYSRNAGTYEAAGVRNPVSMAAVNAQAYLAAPTQVSLGFATLVMSSGYSPQVGDSESLGILLPTYANRLGGSGEADRSISSVVEVSPSLTTNGALPDLLFRGSWTSLLAALAAIGLAAWGAGRFLSSEGVGPVVGGVIIYGFAELWRIFLFNQGILHFLVLVGIASVVVGKLREPSLLAAPRAPVA